MLASAEGSNDAQQTPTAGFRINYNFNTHQMREIEVTFVADRVRYGQLQRGDILLQINGRNCDAMTEKELNRYLVNSSNPRPPSPDLIITQLTIYRPYVPGLVSDAAALAANGEDEASAPTTVYPNSVSMKSLNSLNQDPNVSDSSFRFKPYCKSCRIYMGNFFKSNFK